MRSDLPKVASTLHFYTNKDRHWSKAGESDEICFFINFYESITTNWHRVELNNIDLS